MTSLPEAWWRMSEADLGIVRPFVGLGLWLRGWGPDGQQAARVHDTAGGRNYPDHGDAVLCSARDEYSVCRAGLYVSGAEPGGADFGNYSEWCW